MSQSLIFLYRLKNLIKNCCPLAQFSDSENGGQNEDRLAFPLFSGTESK